jgi:hypothetical protein
MARKRFAECEEAARSSSLAERVDRAAVSRLLTDGYRRAWESSLAVASFPGLRLQPAILKLDFTQA